MEPNLFSSQEHSAGNADGKYLWLNPVDVMEDADHLDYYHSATLLYALVWDCRLRKEIRLNIYSWTIAVYIISTLYYKIVSKVSF